MTNFKIKENFNYFNIFLIFFLTLTFILLTYSISNFIIDIFGDRDLVRSNNLFETFETFGADFGMQGGRRIPGGFNYYYINFLFIFSKNIIVINYISYFFSIISIWYLSKKNFSNLNLSVFLITIIIFITSDTFIYQSKKFWNPSLGLPFITFSLIFFYNFIQNNRSNNLFYFFLFSFLATQFHISYISIPILGLIIFIFIHKKNIFESISIFFMSIIVSYLPLIIDLIFNIFKNNENDYQIIKDNYIQSFKLIKIDTLKEVIFFKVTKLYHSLSFSELSVAFLVLVLIVLFLFFFRNKIKQLLKKKIELFIFFFLISLFFITLLIGKNLGTEKFNFFLIFFILSSFCYFLIINNTNLFLEKSFVVKVINLKTLIFLSIIIFSSLGYVFSYGVINVIIGDSSRYSLVITPLYALLFGYYIAIILIWSKQNKKLKYLVQTIIIIFLSIKFISFYNNVVTNSKNYYEYNYLNKVNMIKTLKNEFNLSKKNFLNNVSFYIYKSHKIENMQKPSFEYYVNNFVKDNNSKNEKCFLVISNTFLNDYKKEPFESVIKKLNSLEYLNKISEDQKIDFYKFENFFIGSFIPRLGGCPKGLLNDYILSKKEKEKYNFLKNKNPNKSYQIKKNDIFKYYLKLSDKNLDFPINFLFEIEIIENRIEVTLHSKNLRNSDTFLDGFWDETHLLNPSLIFVNNSNKNKIKYNLVNGKLGNDSLKTPWNIFINNLSKGEYSLFFQFDEIRQKYNKKVNYYDKIFLLDKSFVVKI